MDDWPAFFTLSTIFIFNLYVGRLLLRRIKLSWRLSNIPGPIALPIVGTTLTILFLPRNGVLDHIRKHFKSYWPIWLTWIGPYPEVNLVQANHIEQILSNTTHLEKSFAYKFLYPWLGTGLLTSTGMKWHTHRKMITPTFHFKILDTFMEVFNEKSEILVDKLQKIADGKTFNVYPYITRCALDIICDTAMGTEIHAQEDVDSEYVKAVYDISEITFTRALTPWTHPDFIFFRTSKGKRFAQCLNILHGFTKRVIAERKLALSGGPKISAESSEEDRMIGKKRRKAFLDLLLEASEKDGRLTDEEIREEVDTFMFEGHDTTAANMSWILLMLAIHPDVQEKVYAELYKIFQSSGRSATMKDVNEMKYLEQVIKETLRLYPSVPFIQRTASEDVKIDKYDIPAGTTFTLQIYFAHRNPEHFPDPETFNPDNFLQEKMQSRHPFAFIPFSAGPRNCIGTMVIGSVLLALAAITISSVYLGRLLIQRIKLIWRLWNLPGPLSLPIVGTTFWAFFVPRNGVLEYLKKYLPRYFPIWCAWLGPYPEINLVKAEHIEQILSNTKHLEKSFIYKFIYPWLGTGLLTSSGTKWHTHRKLITPTFHFKILDTFMEVFNEKSDILVDKLQKIADGKTFNIYPYITRCALDIICDTAMGTEMRAQEDVDSEYVKAVYDISEITFSRAVRQPWLYPDFIFYRTKRGKRFTECLNILHGFTKKVIAERKLTLSGNTKISSKSSKGDCVTGKKSRKAFLDLLLEVSENGARLTDEEIREEVDTFMFEGHDTTAANMSWVLLMLAIHPEIQKKVYAELYEIFQSSGRSATMKDVNEMKYLEQVIKETLRLYPSVPFIQRTVSEDVKIDKYDIPAGTTFTVQIYLAHHNPEHFPDPETFNPDNFLQEKIQSRHPFAYIPFSAGPRNCIGQKFASIEEKVVISSILRKFKLCSSQKREDIRSLTELVLRPDGGVKVSLTPRE